MKPINPFTANLPKKAAKKTLTKAERDENLKKFLELSVVKERMFHGSTNPDIVQFKTGKTLLEERYPQIKVKPFEHSQGRDATFLTPDPQFASRYSGEDWYVGPGTAPTIYPVRVQAQNPWDYDNPEHIEAAIKLYKEKFPLVRDSSGAVPSHESKRHHYFEETMRQLPLREKDNWTGIERPEMQEVIRDLGHDSFYVKEQGIKNLGIYDPKKIKSDLGNQGTYDVTDPDINKAAGGAVKKVAKALTAAERKANLDKFLEPSAVQMRLYHGTGATEGGKGQEAIRQFKPSKEGALGSGTYLTPQPNFANTYAETPAGYTLPVYAQIKNPLILRQKSPDRYKDPMIEALELLGMDSEKAAKMVERAYETKGYIGKEVESRAKAAGYDGLLDYDRHGNLSEVVSYNPSAIKSALGNEGTYDTSTPLLNKAEGGLIRMQDGGDPTQMFNFNPMAAKAAAQERMRREAAEANRYKSVMGSTPQDLLRRIEPEPAQMTETPRSAMPTTIDRAVVSGLQALGAPKSQARGLNQLLDKSVGMFVPDPERLYHEASEAAKKGDLYELITGPGLEATLGYMPLLGAGAKFAMPAIKAAGRRALRPIDSAMFGQGPLANALSFVSPMNVNAPVSRLGFYNPIEEMATTLQRKQGPGQAFLNEFTKAGISKQRLEDAGLAQKLAAAPNVTREEVQAMTKGTMPDVEEVVLSRSVIPPYMKGFANLHMPNIDVNDYRQINQLRKIADERYKKALAENDLDAAEFAMKAEEDINKFSRTHSYGTKPGERLTEFHDYQEPGGKNYREILLKVPVKRVSEEDARRILNAQPEDKLTDYDIEFASRKANPEFRSAHWSDPNVISHIRMNDRVDAEGKNVLFIEELQSDWAQEGRKKGFAPKDFERQIKEGEKRLVIIRDQLAAIKSKLDQPGLAPDERISLMDEYGALTSKQAEEIDWGNNLIDAKNAGIPEGPFVKNTNEWVDLSLKNIIKRAVDEGYDRVAFIDGYKSFLRFPQDAKGESTEAGMRKFYDEIVPGRLKALVGKDNVRTIPGITQQRPLDVSLQGDRYYVVDADTDIAIPDHPGFRSLERAEQYLDELYSKSKSMDQIGFDITPEIREKFSQPIPYKHGGVVKMAAGGAKKLKRASEAIAKFQDPQATKIQEWQWKPLAEVNKQLNLAEVPDYIQRGYGDFMIEQGKRAAAGNLGVRDLIKAYGITQSSIGRGGLSYDTATKAGLKVPKTEGLVRPEGAFAEWLGSKQGQKFLDDAERGVVNEKALDDIRAKFAPFGKANQLTEQLRYGVNNMSTLVPQMQQALVGSADEYRDWAESIKGIAGAKSGFIGSMLGRGDLPTLDARQLNLHSLESPVAPQTMMQRGKGLGAREAVDRLAARQSALGLDIDPSLDPYYQHLAHHAVWDKVADEKTTHEDLMRALRGYKEGGEPDTDAMRLEMMRKSWRSK